MEQEIFSFFFSTQFFSTAEYQVRCLICLVRFNWRPLKQRFTNLFLLVSNRTASSKNQLLNFAAGLWDGLCVSHLVSFSLGSWNNQTCTCNIILIYSLTTEWQVGRLGASRHQDGSRMVTVLRRVVYRNLSPCVYFTLWWWSEKPSQPMTVIDLFLIKTAHESN